MLVHRVRGGRVVDVVLVLELFDAGRDGVEDPDDDQNRSIGMGDYTPPAWFTTFDGMIPRDPRRPFRR